jgi:hypothetical protein
MGLLSFVLIFRELSLRSEVEAMQARSLDLEQRLRQLDEFERDLARMELLGEQVRVLAGVADAADSLAGLGSGLSLPADGPIDPEAENSRTQSE